MKQSTAQVLAFHANILWILRFSRKLVEGVKYSGTLSGMGSLNAMKKLKNKNVCVRSCLHD